MRHNRHTSHVQVYDAHAAPRKHVDNLTELRGGNIEKALSHVQSGGVCSLSVCSCSGFIRCSFWSTQGHSWHMAILQITSCAMCCHKDLQGTYVLLVYRYRGRSRHILHCTFRFVCLWLRHQHSLRAPSTWDAALRPGPRFHMSPIGCRVLCDMLRP